MKSAFAIDKNDIVNTYIEIASAAYEDSLITAKTLKQAVNNLVATPNQNTLDAARLAWLKARIPYQQTETYRFGNAVVDEWEGKVNAWPLDEGLIDYVAGDITDENAYAAANIIANERLRVSGADLDASVISRDLVRSLHELEGIEANVATGYHAIEFLLWGQDLNGTEAGAGNRPASDFDIGNCTGGNCARRVAYLQSVTDLLIGDLEEMVASWQSEGRAASAVRNGDSLNVMFTGMGSLAYGELAGERMRLGLMLHDPEEEHDCFSDNTHNSHFYDAKGIQNVWLGQYSRVDGSKVEGPSLYAYVAMRDQSVADELSAKLDVTMEKMTALVKAAESGMAYDQMLAAGNQIGNEHIQAGVDALIDQTRSIERAAAAAEVSELSIGGSDSLDNPNAIFE